MKRYEPDIEYHEADRGYPGAYMDESETGDYVVYEDVKKELAKLKRYKKMWEKLKEINKLNSTGPETIASRDLSLMMETIEKELE